MKLMQHRRAWALFVGIAILSLVLSACGASRDEDGEISVDSVEVVILESFPVQAHAVVRGTLSDGCTRIQSVSVTRLDPPDTFDVRIEVERDPTAGCAKTPVSYEETVPLQVEGLKAGSYTVTVHDVTADFELAVDNVLE